MSEFLKTKIEYLKGVGSKKADILRKEINISTYYDLLYYFPYRYDSRLGRETNQKSFSPIFLAL